MHEFLVLLLLFLINGVFSMSEIALVSARRTRLEQDARRGDTRAKAALTLTDSPSRFLSTVQIGITLIGILTGIYSGENITKDLEDLIRGMPTLSGYAHSLAVSAVVVVVTFFSLILGELVPKRIGLTYPEPIAKLVALPMRIVSIVTAPFIWLLTITTELLLRVLRIRPRPGGGVTEEEIRAMVHEGAEGGEVQAIEQDIVNRVFSLGDRRISSLMTHRNEMVVLEVDTDVTTLRTLVVSEMHSVYPVCEVSPDRLVGIVTLKDLFQHMDRNGFRLRDILRQPPYLLENLSAYKALERFKRGDHRYGMVTDEFGTVQGIVTINDILEALVGDVSEFYGGDFTLSQREDGSWLVDGQYPLHELLVRIGEPALARDVEVDTIGGLFLYHSGRVPKAGDSIRWVMFDIEVVDMDGARIDKILLRRSEQ